MLSEPVESNLLSVLARLEALLVILPCEVYFDDTGCNHRDQPVFMWCGLLASMSYWHQFGVRWKSALRHRPEVPYWDQKNARNLPRQAPFDALSDTQLTEREEELAKLCGFKHPGGGNGGCVAIVVRLPMQYYQSIVKGKIHFGKNISPNFPRALREELVNSDILERPHYIAFQYATIFAMNLVRQWHQKCPEQILPVLNCIYDQRAGDRYQTEVLESWDELKLTLQGKWNVNLGSIKFESAKTGLYPGLESADMLAWHLGQRSRRETPTRGDDPMWKYVSRTAINEIRLGVNELTDHVNRWNDGLPPHGVMI